MCVAYAPLINAIITISAAILFLSSIGLCGIEEAAPGQSVESRLLLESDGGADIFLEAPASIDDWVLVPSASQNVRQNALRIWASTDWQMAVSSDRDDGRMAEYDLAASEYVPDGRVLESPMRVASLGMKDGAVPVEVDLPEGGLICRGGETSADGQEILVALLQKVAWTDEPLEDGQAYRIALTFTVSPVG